MKSTITIWGMGWSFFSCIRMEHRRSKFWGHVCLMGKFRVPAGVWQGSVVAHGGKYCLAGTTMAPAYLPEDYEHGDMKTLCAGYPDAEAAIRRRCGEAIAR